MILIGLLTYSKYPTIEPFIPLQNYGEKKDKEVDEITKKWGDFIIESINLTSKKKRVKKKTKKSKSRKSKTKKR